MAAILIEQEGCLLLRVKAIPGAQRSGIGPATGDRLKVKVSAAPEKGKANKAISELLAKRLGLTAREIELQSGSNQALKTFQLRGICRAEAAARLGLE